MRCDIALFGDLFGGNAEQEANRNRRQQEQLSQLFQSWFKQYYPQALAYFANEAQAGTPGYVNALWNNQRTAITQGTRDALGSTLMSNYSRGMGNSNIGASLLAAVTAQGNRDLAGARANLDQYADQRQQGLNQTLAGLSAPLGGQAMSGFGNSAAGWSNAAQNSLGNTLAGSAGLGQLLGYFTAPKTQTPMVSPPTMQPAGAPVMGMTNGAMPFGNNAIMSFRPTP